MEILTKADVIKGVPANWKRQYPNGKEGIYEKLMAAKPLTKEKVDTIIGNESWTMLICDECGRDVKLVVFLGKNNDHDTAICERCLNKAIRVIERHHAKS